MKFISTSSSLTSTLLRLIGSYDNISFGVAWASSSSKPYELLLAHKGKIRAGVIGTHFYQTHPDVLDHFVQSEAIKFVLQPRGVFHPKVYVFWSANRWEAIVGSANFTVGAMNENTELCTLLTDTDGDHLNDLLALIQSYMQAAKSVTAEEAANYRRIWKAKQPELQRLVDQYGDKAPKKSAIQSHVMGMDWPVFLAEVQKDVTHGFDDRLDLLAKMKRTFASTPHFQDMDAQTRRAIAGLPNQVMENAAWFGSMKGAGVFKNVVIEDPLHLSKALDEIPATGTVTREQYDSFISQYIKAFPNGRDGIATATRLLSMKRPDQFLCVDSANRRKLANDVGMTNVAQLDYERYWVEVVARIMDSPWWKSPAPKSGKELQAWRARAAMLDAIFYEPST
jgi:HKD family nuclease